MLVREIMKEPICIEAEETLEAAALKLKNDNVGCLPVCEARQVIGMLTDRDVLMRGTASRRNPSQTKVREAMSTEIHCCSEGDPVEQAASIMSSNHVQRLPVLNSKQELVGVVSLTDLTGGASHQRAPFEVVFYKELGDSYGRPHHVELMRIIVGPGHTKEEAVAAAIKRVEQEKQTAWKSFADGYDVTEVHTDEQGGIMEEVERTSEKEARVRRRAYELWERGDRPKGGHESHWEQASREIETEDAATREHSPE